MGKSLLLKKTAVYFHATTTELMGSNAVAGSRLPEQIRTAASEEKEVDTR
jgi:hypothetical protein